TNKIVRTQACRARTSRQSRPAASAWQPASGGSGGGTDSCRKDRISGDGQKPAGGGGIGLQLCRSAADLRERFATVQRLGEANFKQNGVYLEKYVERARHL